jgi:hypothetical protein
MTPTHLRLLPKAANQQMETLCHKRSVWAVVRPLPNPAPHLYSSSFAFPPWWALLELRQTLSDPTAADTDLGNLRAVNDKQNSAEVINQPAFSMRSYQSTIPSYTYHLSYCAMPSTALASRSIRSGLPRNLVVEPRTIPDPPNTSKMAPVYPFFCSADRTWVRYNTSRAWIIGGYGTFSYIR